MIAALLAALATASPPASSTPQEIFNRTFTRLASYPVAPYAVEIATRREVATSTDPRLGGTREYATRYAFRNSDAVENVTLYPALSTALPQALIAKGELGAFAWSARPADVKAPQEAGQPAAPDIPAPYKTIAHVVAYAPLNYSVEVSGIEPVDSHPCYDLRLRPLSDPMRHNLRELWVDTATFDLRKATFDGTYRPVPLAPSSPSTFTSSFAAIGPYWIVSHQHWTWTDTADSIYLDINMEVNKITFPATLPDYLFDQAEYDKRQNAREPDPLDAILNEQ